jgi:hypothetical protein
VNRDAERDHYEKKARCERMWVRLANERSQGKTEKPAPRMGIEKKREGRG